MPKKRTASPARSQGGATTPKRKSTRGSRSLCSPALSTASGRLTSLIDQFKYKKMESFALSPLNSRSVLNDNTEIEEPRRKSWWKKLDENSQDVMEVLEDNRLTVNNAIEEFIDVEVLSQEKKNYTLDLPESSDNESINSIVLPQRRLFTQKENLPQKKYGHLIDNRESLAKLHKTNTANIDKTVNVGTRELFQNAKRSKPIFPAALLNISPNKTAADKTRENVLADPKPQVRNIFGNRPANKRKNMFADFIVSESEDEIPEIQPKVFGFQKKLEQRRISSISKGRDASPASSITTDIEMDFRMLLPSSTMVENQLEDDMLADNTPIKRARLSKLSEAKESEAGTLQRNTTSDKTKQSNKSVASKNETNDSPEVKDKSLNSSRTTRSMSKSDSKREESFNTAVKQNAKGNKSRNKIYSKGNELDVSPSKSDTDKQNTALNKSQEQNKSRTRNSPKETEMESEENVNIVNQNKSINNSLPNTTATNKSINEKERTVTLKVHDKGNKTGSNDIAQNYQEDENNFTLQYENDDNEVVEEAEVYNDLNENQKDNTKKHNSVVFEETEIIKSKSNKSNLINKSLQQKPAKIVEESVESQTDQYSADDNVDGNQEQELETVKNKDEEMISEEIDEDANNSREDMSDRKVIENNDQENEDEVNLHQENEEERNKTEDNQDQVNISQENDNEQNESQEEVANKSQGVENVENESEEEKEEDENEGNESEEEEVTNESQEVEAEVNESREIEEVNESQEIDVEVNESQEIDEKANESQVVKEDANESQEIEEEGNEYQGVGEEANESQEVEAEVNEIQEIDEKAHDSQIVEDDDALEENVEEINENEEEVENDEEENHEVASEAESEEVEDDDAQEENDEEINEDEKEAANEASVNKSQEVESDEEESHELASEAESGEVEDDDDQEENDEEINEDEEKAANAASANKSQEVENDEEECHEVASEAESEEVEDDQQMDDTDEADEAISDPEISDDNQVDEMEVDGDEEQESDNESEQNEHESHEKRQIEEQNEIEPSEEIEESPNVTHDTTGRHREKHLKKSPEVILHDKTNQVDSFIVKGRNTSVRKTKSMIKNLNIRPSLAPPRDSTGFSDGTKNSSAEGSGWDSHRVTRKTLRQTFGKDFTPRKSLRALVMEKSAKRQTEHMDLHSETVKFPLANSTEMPEDSNHHVEDIVESDHEMSRRTRQTTLETYLQKIKEQNIEKKLKMEAAVRNSLKNPVSNPLSLFKVPNKPAPRRPKPTQSKSKKQLKSIIPFDELPSEVLEDMKYKPPKRFQPTNASWITKRLYKFLENKLEAKYDYKARVRAEKLVETIYFFAKDLRRHNVAPTDAVDVLKHELARLEVVRTHFEFYEFFHEFMPREVRVKVVPDIVNKIALPRHGVYSDILRGNTIHG